MSCVRTMMMLAAVALSAMACSPGDEESINEAGQRASETRADSAPLPHDSGSSSTAAPQLKGAPAARTVTPSASTKRPLRNPTPSRRRVLVADVDLTGVGYDVGSTDAPVVIVNFSDFGCPFCGSFSRETYPVIEAEYVRTGKVFFKYVPFVMGMFPNGSEAARAAECAGDGGSFWAMHDSLYASQSEWKKSRAPLAVFQRMVAHPFADRRHFDACYADSETHPRTRRNNAAAEALGIRVTPSFVVNGRPIEGALPLVDFRRVIEAALLLEQARR